MTRFLTLAGMATLVSFGAAAQDDQTALLDRGAYLMNGIVACGNCHTMAGPDGPDLSRELAGGLPFEEEAFTAFASNITPDIETGIGGWTNQQISVAIRDGIRPDGSLIGPPMPYADYRHMADEDVDALVAYLTQVAPIDNDVPASTYNFPLPPAYGPPVSEVTAPDSADQVAYGGYLATIGHCFECHTPMVEGHFDESRRGGGGTMFPGPWGISIAANITSDPEDGLGSWTDEQIVRAITQGISHDGTPLYPPMGFGYYANMTSEDLAALVTYLRTVEPVSDPS